MTTIHLQPESAHATSASLKQTGDLLAAHLQELASAIQRLDSAWQGGDKGVYHADMSSLLRTLNSRQEELALLAARLEREIQEWEQIDQHGVSAWQGSQWSVAWLTGGAFLPAAGGLAGMDWPFKTTILPLTAAVSIGAFFAGVPAWLQGILDKFFPPAPILSPLPDEPAQGKTGSFANLIDPPPSVQTATPSASPAAQPAEQTATASATPAPAAPSTPAVPDKKYDILYDVPTESQGTLYGSAACAPTSVSMVLDYFHTLDPKNQSISADKLVAMMDQGDGTPGQGIALTNLNDELNSLGYNHITTQVNASLADLKSQLQSGPVVVTTGVKIVGSASVPRAVTGPGGTMHAMVVKGIGTDGVLVNDPWSGSEMQITTDTFNQMWSNGSGGMYAVRP